MITVTLDSPELEQELWGVADAQQIDVGSVIVGALAQCFNKPKLLTTLGFAAKPLSAAGAK